MTMRHYSRLTGVEVKMGCLNTNFLRMHGQKLKRLEDPEGKAYHGLGEGCTQRALLVAANRRLKHPANPEPAAIACLPGLAGIHCSKVNHPAYQGQCVSD